MTELKITRVVTDLVINTGTTTYDLNGHAVWIGHKIKHAGKDNGNRGFHHQLYKLCNSIALNTPGITVDMSDPFVVEFLKGTECI